MPAKYSVFSIRLKESPEWFPIGVVLWSSELDLVLMRLISSAERPREIPKEDYPLIEQFKEDLEVCQSAEYLAIRKLELKPSTEEFWKFVRDSLSKRFRLSQEFHVKSDNLEDELVSLFHKIVSPTIDPADWTRDSVVIK